MQQSTQIHLFIKQCLRGGQTTVSIKQQLEAAGWNELAIEQSMQAELLKYNSEQVRNKKRRRLSIVLIASPFIVLITNALFQVLAHTMSIDSTIINTVSLIAGCLGILLLFIGPVAGIIVVRQNY